MQANLTVQSLRDKGYKIRIIHKRNIVRPRQYKNKWVNEYRLFTKRDMATLDAIGVDYIMSPFGGQTEVDITTPNGEDYSVMVHCHTSEQFNKRLAIKVALGKLSKFGAIV